MLFVLYMGWVTKWIYRLHTMYSWVSFITTLNSPHLLHNSVNILSLFSPKLYLQYQDKAGFENISDMDFVSRQ